MASCMWSKTLLFRAAAKLYAVPARFAEVVAGSTLYGGKPVQQSSKLEKAAARAVLVLNAYSGCEDALLHKCAGGRRRNTCPDIRGPPESGDSGPEPSEQSEKTSRRCGRGSGRSALRAESAMQEQKVHPPVSRHVGMWACAFLKLAKHWLHHAVVWYFQCGLFMSCIIGKSGCAWCASTGNPLNLPRQSSRSTDVFIESVGLVFDFLDDTWSLQRASMQGSEASRCCTFAAPLDFGFASQESSSSDADSVSIFV